jgi:hypothetical protein
VPQGVGESNRGGGLADPFGRGGHGADEHQVAVGLALAGGQLINRDLGDEMPVGENALRVQLQLFRDLLNPARRQPIIDRWCFRHAFY